MLFIFKKRGGEKMRYEKPNKEMNEIVVIVDSSCKQGACNGK